MDAGERGNGGSPRLYRTLASARDLLAWVREHEEASDPRTIDWLSRIEAEIDSR